MLGHQCTADRNTMVDVEHRMAAASREFNKDMHLWTHPRLRIKAKLRMFRRHLMQLIYAGAQCWLLTDEVQRRLNWWTADHFGL